MSGVKLTRQGIRDLGGGRQRPGLVPAPCFHIWEHDPGCPRCDVYAYDRGGYCTERCFKCKKVRR